MLNRLSFHYYLYIIMGAVATLLILLAVIACHRTAVSVQAGSNEETGHRVECFQSIQIQPGDSLWSISRRYYSSEYKSIEQYMRRIMALNHMSDARIHTGGYLVIPYYTQCAPKEVLVTVQPAA